MKYRVHPIHIGNFTVAYHGDDVKFPKVVNIPSFIFLLFDENGEALLVDTGFDIDHIPAPDSYGERIDGLEISDLIKKFGVDPLKIKKIIQTHLHWDHTAGLKYFPNAEIYLQVGEIKGLLDLQEFEDVAFNTSNWLDRTDSFILIHGDHKILPGIEVIHTGIHTPGHQSVKVQGEDKTILLLGDAPFTYDWLWTMVPHKYWASYKNGDGKKFFWTEDILPVIEKWYNKNKNESQKPLKDYPAKELYKLADISIFSHDPKLINKDII
ncbi:MAG: MBL fold metallo-hydrolase [Spirochaetes bacterium]|nr:MBL fold metallo-hydrolase [Spirochaetota bacterium]